MSIEMDDRKEDAEQIPKEWLEEFEAAARRPLKTRMRYAFIAVFPSLAVRR